MSRQREVPQFINIEDKIAFQLTARQLGWVAVGGFFAFLAWAFLEQTYFVITSIVIVVFLIAVLFIKPYGQTLPAFLGNVFSFIFRPKVYIWRKGYQDNHLNEFKKMPKVINKAPKQKKSSPTEIKKAIKSLDIYE